jgi:hypothetical protein
MSIASRAYRSATPYCPAALASAAASTRSVARTLGSVVIAMTSSRYPIAWSCAPSADALSAADTSASRARSAISAASPVPGTAR